MMFTEALLDKTLIAQVAPAVRVALGERFGDMPGTMVQGRLVAALRQLGFDYVFDTQFSADLTIMEEGHEFLDRLQNGSAPLPMFTSCCPAWVQYAESALPALLPHLSSCKSPQQMFGAIAKTWLAERLDRAPEDIALVSIMPCHVKKAEAARPEMTDAAGYWHRTHGLEISDTPDVDFVITTDELAQMIEEAGMDWWTLPESDFDQPLGESTGAGAIFGTTGGVMEAALRTIWAKLTGANLTPLDFEAVRGDKALRSAQITLPDGTSLAVAIVFGMQQAKKLSDEALAGKSPYHFIEVMNCEGGCIGGGGQPAYEDKKAQALVREHRMAALYRNDRAMPRRQSHENPAIQRLYREFLDEPLSHRAHELLHTHYAPQPS